MDNFSTPLKITGEREVNVWRTVVVEILPKNDALVLTAKQSDFSYGGLK